MNRNEPGPVVNPKQVLQFVAPVPKEQIFIKDADKLDKRSITITAQELAIRAMSSRYWLDIWNTQFRGVCPGCAQPHNRMSPWIKKGICVKCHVRITEEAKGRKPVVQI